MRPWQVLYCIIVPLCKYIISNLKWISCGKLLECELAWIFYDISHYCNVLINMSNAQVYVEDTVFGSKLSNDLSYPILLLHFILKYFALRMYKPATNMLIALDPHIIYHVHLIITTLDPGSSATACIKCMIWVPCLHSMKIFYNFD